MATIRNRGQSWQVQVRKAGSSPINRTFLRKSDAEKWARQLEADIERAPYGLDRGKLSSLMLVDLLIRYRDEITPSKRGADVERYRVARLLEHKLAMLTLDRLTPGQIAAYRDERLAQVGPQTVRHELNLIRHVLNIARREWDIPLTVNPVAEIKLPSPQKSRDRRLIPGELIYSIYRRNLGILHHHRIPFPACIRSSKSSRTARRSTQKSLPCDSR